MQLFDPPEVLLSDWATQQQPCQESAGSNPRGERGGHIEAELGKLVQEFHLPSISEAVAALVNHPQVCLTPLSVSL